MSKSDAQMFAETYPGYWAVTGSLPDHFRVVGYDTANLVLVEVPSGFWIGRSWNPYSMVATVPGFNGDTLQIASTSLTIVSIPTVLPPSNQGIAIPTPVVTSSANVTLSSPSPEETFAKQYAGQLVGYRGTNYVGKVIGYRDRSSPSVQFVLTEVNVSGSTEGFAGLYWDSTNMYATTSDPTPKTVYQFYVKDLILAASAPVSQGVGSSSFNPITISGPPIWTITGSNTLTPKGFLITTNKLTHDPKEYPHKCMTCGSAAYISPASGATSCTNRSCKNLCSRLKL